MRIDGESVVWLAIAFAWGAISMALYVGWPFIMCRIGLHAWKPGMPVEGRTIYDVCGRDFCQQRRMR